MLTSQEIINVSRSPSHTPPSLQQFNSVLNQPFQYNQVQWMKHNGQEIAYLEKDVLHDRLREASRGYLHVRYAAPVINNGLTTVKCTITVCLTMVYDGWV